MFNIISILVSLAMLLTGVAAPVDGAPVQLEAPVARTLTLSNIQFSHNAESFSLNPKASLGVSTDGAQAIYDFAVHNGDQTLLPYQLVVDESGLLLYNDNSNVTLRATAEELETLVNQEVNGAMGDIDAEDRQILDFLTQEFFPAYVNVFRMLGDKDQLKAFKAQSEDLMYSVIDRGEAKEGTIDDEGQELPVTYYEYTMTSADIARLADAVYDSNETLAAYRDAYFKFIKLVAEQDEGAEELKDLDSFEKIMNMVDMSLQVTESYAEDGREFTNQTMVVNMPQIEGGESLPPFTFEVSTVQNGDDFVSIINGDYTVYTLGLSFTGEAAQEGEEFHFSMSVSANETDYVEEDEEEVEEDDEAEIEEEDEAEADEDEAEEAETEEAEAPEIVEDILVPMDDGETDEEDMFYASVNFYSQPGGAEGDTAYGINYYISAQGLMEMSYDVTGLRHADGSAENAVIIAAALEDDVYNISFDLDISTDPIALRADAANAVSLEDSEEAMGNIGASAVADALNLYLDDSVQHMISMVMNTTEEDEEDDYESDGREAEPYDDGSLAFGEPEFTWLPEGYALEDADIDTQYDMASYIFTDQETNESIFVNMFGSFETSKNSYYAVSDDGTIQVVDGRLVTEQDSGDSRSYTCDDGTVQIYLYATADAVDVEAVCHIISGIQFK